ncbi:hypothetical protein [Sphingomonas aerolata]|uniref:hypothetical protein n=1 Tax=Sphingomonas aerolata TaxID=185951 RepID=UPI002FDFF7D2
MAEAITVSIQKTTTGGVTEFLGFEEFDCLGSIKLLSFLAGALLRYEEEGIELSPQIILCQSIESVTRSIPGGTYYVIGAADFSPDLGKKILKECAALAQSVWAIFVERVDTTTVRYGVMSYLATPTSISLADMIAIDSTNFAVLIARADATTVRLVGAKGNSLDVAFSTVRESIKSDRDIVKFADSCVAADTAEPSKRYMRSLIERLLAGSHGTILACSTTDILEVEGMTDAIGLSPPIDVMKAFESYRADGTADALLELQRTEALLQGLLQSDGIVTFNDGGQITAYRVFYKPPSAANTTAEASPTVSGGARRRAFEGVKALVGSALKSALFRSQDGHTLYVGN